MYTIGLHFKPIQMYTDIVGLYFKAKSSMYIIQMYTDNIGLYFKAKSSVYISNLKHEKGAFSLILKLWVFFKIKVRKGKWT